MRGWLHPTGLAAGALIGLTVFSAATACTGIRSGTGSPVSSSVAIPPAAAAPPPPTAVPTYTQYPVPASVPNDPSKSRQVHVSGCSSTGSSAAATGTVHNTGSRAASYDITVFFTSDTATAVNFATTKVQVSAGATADFTAQRAFVAPQQILCVLVGVS